MGQQRTDRTTAILGHAPKDVPVDLFEPQASGKTIQAHRPGQWLNQCNVELADQRIDLSLLP
jgi:hypothetical protein